MKLKFMRYAAFTRMDFIIIVAVLVVLAFVTLPLIARRSARTSRTGCTNNLKQIGLAYRQWSIDDGDKYPAAVSTADGGAKEWIEAGAVYTSYLVLSNELNTPKILICPEDRTPKRVQATTFEWPSPSPNSVPFTNNDNVSYFVGLDADETEPQRILVGDDNFLVGGVKPKPGVLSLWTNTPVAWTKDRHAKQGNVGLADGSVMGVSTSMFQHTLINTEMATNRLAMP
jgi:prepilin-type processing-associated H-X9-DG protein